MRILLLFSLLFFLFSCNGGAQHQEEAKPYSVQKSREEWKKELSPQEFRVLRQGATEPAFSSPLNQLKDQGIYHCAACRHPLYRSSDKFDSGTGWPSFDRAIAGSVDYGRKVAGGFEKNEVHCSRCGSHLGHVFDDGPRKTTGKRHCINGVALEFIPEKIKEP